MPRRMPHSEAAVTTAGQPAIDLSALPALIG